MMPIGWLIIGGVVVFSIGVLIVEICACALSSQISQREESAIETLPRRVRR